MWPVRTLPFYWLGALLQTSARSGDAQGKTLPVVVVPKRRAARGGARRRSAGQPGSGGQEPRPAAGPPARPGRHDGAGLGRRGADLQPGGAGAVYGEAGASAARRARPAGPAGDALPGAAPDQPAPVPQPDRVPLVLVVDDSITVRRVTQRLLQREGYRVVWRQGRPAGAGALADELPTVVLSDIEMPRMDGFDLVRNIRADARLKHLPVIMITSRIAKSTATRHGARRQHYLGKPYQGACSAASGSGQLRQVAADEACPAGRTSRSGSPG
jgi:chemosensory pili system protein ChpA (sensor histidine kinase/response regulator)